MAGRSGMLYSLTSSYDDFIAFSRPKLVGSTEKSVIACLNCWGESLLKKVRKLNL